MVLRDKFVAVLARGIVPDDWRLRFLGRGCRRCLWQLFMSLTVISAALLPDPGRPVLANSILRSPPTAMIPLPKPKALSRTAEAMQASKTQPAKPLARPKPPQLVAETPTTNTRTMTVRKGETLLVALARSGVDRSDAFRAVNALQAIFDPRRLAAGQKINIHFDAFLPQTPPSPTPPSQTPGPPKSGPDSGTPLKRQFTGFNFHPDVRQQIDVGLTPDGKFAAVTRDRALTMRPQRVSGTIDDSLYNAARAANMPIAVLTQMIRVFSFDVDFQREIRRGDHFDVFYTQAFDNRGTAVPVTEIQFAAMTLSTTPRPYYRFTPSSGITDYFDPRGQSVKKTLMRTPIDGARLSSGFGRRKHPILGYTKLHRGADFAAPKGTPIMAAGDGVIASIGRKGHYGKDIRIRHNSTYSTAYAHLSAYRRGLKRGSRVIQGQTIGYVGSTGRSTGPHLHYEVLVDNKQRNPLNIKLPSGEQLSGKDLIHFNNRRAQIDDQRNRFQAPALIAKK